MTRYLVVAHQTADSEELVEALRELAAQGDSSFTLVVPATPPHHLATWTEGEARAIAERQAKRAEEALRAVGADVVATNVGDAHPFRAVQDAMRVGSYDTIVVSTFALRKSRWLHMNLIQRLERAIDLPIIHVVAESHG